MYEILEETELNMESAIENMEKRFLENMVRDSNEKVVEEQEYLSNHVYFFDRTRKRVEIVTP